MFDNTPPTSTLQRAVSVCGGIDALAQTLEVSVQSLRTWLECQEVPTLDAYTRVLDMIAGGRGRRRRVKKAVRDRSKR